MPPKSRPQSRGAQSNSAAAVDSRRRMSATSGQNNEQRRKYSDTTLSQQQLQQQQQQQQSQLSQLPVANLYRVRSFTTRSGTVVNRGDSFKFRSGRSAAAAAAAADQPQSTTSGAVRRLPGRQGRLGQRPEQTDPDRQRSDVTWSTGALDVEDRSGFGGSDRVHPADFHESTSSRPAGNAGRTAAAAASAAGGCGVDEDVASITAAETYCVQVIGSSGVGKTTMTQQLLTSEYLANKDFNTEDEIGEATCTTVSVQIDDEESTVRFIDNHGSEGKEGISGGDGYLVVYSVTDRASFRYAQACLQELRPAKRLNAVILVANKYDLVRNRVISTSEGIRLATKRHCKFVEISALLDHRIDELLVGIVRQIRLRQSRDQRHDELESLEHARPKTGSRLVAALGGALRALLARMRVATPTASRSGATGRQTRQAECNNLFTP